MITDVIAPSVMKRQIAGHRFDAKSRSESQPFASAPIAMPTGSEMLTHLPTGSSL